VTKPGKSPQVDDNVDHRTQANNAEEPILRAAEQIFAKYGYRGATTSMIATKAGVKKPNIYYYYKSKEELYRTLLQSTLDMWRQTTKDISGQSDPEKMLTEYIRKKLEFSQRHPLLSKIFANEIFNGAPYIGDQLKSQRQESFDILILKLEKWIAEGKIDPIDPVHLVFSIWGMTQFYADHSAQLQILLEKRRLDENDFEEAAKTITQMVLRGVGLTLPEDHGPI